MVVWASPQARASGRQNCGILRQAHFMTSSKKGVSEPNGHKNLMTMLNQKYPEVKRIDIGKRATTYRSHNQEPGSLTFLVKRLAKASKSTKRGRTEVSAFPRTEELTCSKPGFLLRYYKPSKPSSSISSAAGEAFLIASSFPFVTGSTVLIKKSAVLICPL
jgi:hypothetical protein